MAAKLSRRKYAIATKALNQIIAREATPVDKRLRAIELLFNLHERHDRMHERAEARKTEARKGTVILEEETTVEETPELSAEDTERARINEVLGWVPKADSQR